MDFGFPSKILSTLIPDKNRTDQATGIQKPDLKNTPLPRQADIVSLSGDQQTKANKQSAGIAALSQTRLISETIEKIDNGFRRTQEFQTKEGRPFTKIEEFVTDGNRSLRTVIQQNSSGSTTVLEDILDRQNDGSFRLTRRFTDETGDTKTDIQFNITPLDADILLGREPDIEQIKKPPQPQYRGRELDVET